MEELLPRGRSEEDGSYTYVIRVDQKLTEGRDEALLSRKERSQ